MRVLLTILMLGMTACLYGQDIDSLPPELLDSLDLAVQDTLLRTDSTTVKRERRTIDPKKSALYSLVFPGAGQIYNRKIWKAPLVYGALATTISIIQWNKVRYRDFRDAYIMRLDPDQTDPYVDQVSSAEGLKAVRDGFRKNMELAYFGTFAVYMLQVIEAYVDGHLQQFDVNEDLSIRLLPTHIAPDDLAKAKVGVFIQF